MAKHLDINAQEVAVHAARMRYLAMAALCVNGGGRPAEPDRSNCVVYLLDTLTYLGEQTEDWAQRLYDELEKEARP